MPMPEPKANQYKQIRRYVLTCMILIPFIPMAVILAIGYFYFAAALTQTSTATVRRIADDHRQMIEDFLNERQSDLDFVLQTYRFEELRQQTTLQTVYENLLRKSEAFADLGIFDETGLHVAYQGPHPLAGRIYRDAAWFGAALENGHYISDVFLGYRNTPHFIIAVARETGDGRVVIRATIDTLVFNNLVKDVRIGRTGEAYILNADGLLQTDRRSGGALMAADPGNGLSLDPHDGIRTFVRKMPTGENYLYATTWMQSPKWLVVVRQETAEVFKALKTAVYLVLLAALVGGGAIVGTALYLSDRIILRIRKADLRKDHLESQLMRAGRLAELGEMAAGFAHEINNPLQIIKSEQSLMETIIQDLRENRVSAELEEQDAEELGELEDSIQQIALQVNRCSEITHSILKFGRKTDPQVTRIDLTHFIPEILKMVLKKAEVHGIRLEERIAEETPAIEGDPTQLQQVLLNLCNNAMDAIQARHGAAGGELTVTTGSEGDNRVLIRISDNGCGIAKEDLSKIFRPFFTTKPVGKGTGLGLSICYGIITGMGGKMEVQSKSGTGTTFNIHLPVADSA